MMKNISLKNFLATLESPEGIPIGVIIDIDIKDDNVLGVIKEVVTNVNKFSIVDKSLLLRLSQYCCLDVVVSGEELLVTYPAGGYYINFMD